MLSRVHVAMVVLSAIVAWIGLLRDNVAVVIGAMVIAPLLRPNVALALATFGLLLGSGNVTAAGGALLLVLTNVICVNLAGVVTFWF
jgi:uncharacterized membrane protein